MNSQRSMGSVESLSQIDKPKFSAGQPVKSVSKTSVNSVDYSRPPSVQSGNKPVMKPAAHLTNFDNRRGTGKSITGEDEISASVASSADFDKA